MKRKLLSLLVLLMTAATGAWATDYLYLDISETSATLMYGDVPDGYPYYDDGTWLWNDNSYPGWDDFKMNTLKTITVDALCGSFEGTDLTCAFEDFAALTTIENINNLNTSNVLEMVGMFSGCSSLTTLDLSGWNTSKVYEMGSMFFGCTNLTTLDLSGWDTSNVEWTYLMFSGCTNLTTIYVGAGWSTDKVIEAEGMFSGCTKLPNWDGTTDATHANDGADGYLNKMKLTAHEGETGEYWTTFYDADRNFIAPTGTKVFKVALSGTHLTMYEVEDRIVNSYMPVVLKSTGANIVMTVSTSSAGDGNPNDLSGWAGPGNMAADGNMYVLNNGTQGVGFYKLKDGKSLSPGKAFLYYTGSLAREFFGFDETTGIDATLVNSEKVNSEVYDLQGRRVSQPTKGLYIVNGKKYIKK